jgi:four helix bundle protein
MEVKSFEDLDVRKESMQLTVLVYEALQGCKDFGFRDQIQRSAISVPSNIAEGFERRSHKEFVQYLYVAKGSAAELKTQLYLAVKIRYIDSVVGQQLIDQTTKIASMLYRLIEYRQKFIENKEKH